MEQQKQRRQRTYDLTGTGKHLCSTCANFNQCQHGYILERGQLSRVIKCDDYERVPRPPDKVYVSVHQEVITTLHLPPDYDLSTERVLDLASAAVNGLELETPAGEQAYSEVLEQEIQDDDRPAEFKERSQ